MEIESIKCAPLGIEGEAVLRIVGDGVLRSGIDTYFADHEQIEIKRREKGRKILCHIVENDVLSLRIEYKGRGELTEKVQDFVRVLWEEKEIIEDAKRCFDVQFAIYIRSDSAEIEHTIDKETMDILNKLELECDFDIFCFGDIDTKENVNNLHELRDHMIEQQLSKEKSEIQTLGCEGEVVLRIGGDGVFCSDIDTHFPECENIPIKILQEEGTNGHSICQKDAVTLQMNFTSKKDLSEPVEEFTKILWNKKTIIAKWCKCFEVDLIIYVRTLAGQVGYILGGETMRSLSELGLDCNLHMLS
ncbi:MAG: hypothetical protein Q4A75_09675, partial [Peptostreptococcaceae bacterium]|nr:hypothetical protein [Peptostreptococcaceae bacterium]